MKTILLYIFDEVNFGATINIKIIVNAILLFCIHIHIAEVINVVLSSMWPITG